MFEIIPGTFREGALQLVQNIKYTIILLGVKVTVAIPRLLDPRVPFARENGRLRQNGCSGRRDMLCWSYQLGSTRKKKRRYPT